MQSSLVGILRKKTDGRRVWSLTADEVAEKCKLSRRQFCRSFRAETGLSFREYTDELRLAAIKSALNSFNGRKLKNFDLRSFKFATYPSFSRSFKRQAGLTPSEYLRRRVTKHADYRGRE